MLVKFMKKVAVGFVYGVAMFQINEKVAEKHDVIVDENYGLAYSYKSDSTDKLFEAQKEQFIWHFILTAIVMIIAKRIDR